MYKIGVKQGKWQIITNGNEVYQATDDVRHYSKPPDIRGNAFGRIPDNPVENNRVTRQHVSQDDFDLYCQSNSLEVRGCVTSGEKAKKMAAPATIGGVLGAVVGGPVGAAVEEEPVH